MGYQALLFCPDEKLARVVNQVFSDLDFTIEHVNEPFSAVKKLMAQRYDAIVVDCENEQNASLLFKSARNSGSNQSSLALALVEGQAGVAKAYRIGANLVLTKPINVEQAKGTLRVARGLLRKNVDSAPAAAPTAAPSAAAPATATPAPTKPVPTQPASTFHSAAPTPTISPSITKKYEVPEAPRPMVAEVATPAIAEPPKPAFESVSATPIQSVVASPASERAFPAPVPPPAFHPPAAISASTLGSAAAPAPAKEALISAPAGPLVEKKSTAPEFVGYSQVVAAPSAPSPSAPAHFEAPKFGALEANEAAAASGGSKKIFVAVAAVLVVAAAAYFGWTKFGQKTTTAQTASTPQTVAISTPAPMAATPSTTPSTAPSPAPTAPAAQTPKPSATITSSPVIKIESAPVSEPVVKKPGAPAIVVKSTSPAKKIQAQTEEAAPQVPSPLGVAQDSEKHISNLMASTPVNLPKQAVSTLRISQGVSQGLLIKRAQPRYPQNALSMRLQGTVQLEATIDKEGNVKNIKVLNGDPILARAASDAVHQWRYKPYYLDGQPVEIQTQITVNFKLPN